MRRRALRAAAMCAAVCVVCFSAIQLASYRQESKAQEEAFYHLREISLRPQEQPQWQEQPVEEKRDFAALTAQNPDCVAWISIKDTALDYPVMQTPEDRAEYYLKHSFEGRENRYGVPFLDSRCSLSDSGQLILYGHNMQDGAMFATLENYLKKDFLPGHPLITLETPQETRQYRIFAVLLVPGMIEAEEWNPLQDQTVSEAAWMTMLDEIKKANEIETEYSPVFGQHLIVLVTCDNTPKNGRIVVLGAQEG